VTTGGKERKPRPNPAAVSRLLGGGGATFSTPQNEGPLVTGPKIRTRNKKRGGTQGQGPGKEIVVDWGKRMQNCRNVR